MFDSLDEQMKKDDNRETTSTQRLVRYALYALAGVLVFGGLIFGVHLMS
ncbi:MAG TPA: hypothetical protein VN754_14830 [Candidatus Binataceae bacterium]|nr:hypothetical protein [Candidatus Binataceae bacterium]